MNKYYADWLRRNTIYVQNAVAESNKMSQEAFSKVNGFLSSPNKERNNYGQANQNLYKTSLYQVWTALFYSFVYEEIFTHRRGYLL
jgi:hypothetical protein